MAMTMVALLGASGMAFAAGSGLMLSDFSSGWKQEAKEIFPVVLLILAGVGVVTATVGTISAIFAKKQQQPLSWQGWAVFGGAAAVVIPVIILAASGSLTGGNSNASNQLDELGVEY
ncbi:hypothetical protein D3C77_506450 [compost metagenome]